MSYYDGPASGDDIPADVLFDGLVVVTGTSPGIGTGLDIATVAWDRDGMWASDFWPDDGWGGGRRRYDHLLLDDRAVELGRSGLVTPESEAILQIIVLGTSWNGDSDDFTIHTWGGTDGELVWEDSYDNGGEDVATALWVEGDYVFVAGYSENATSSFGPTGPGDFDYATIYYTWDGTRQWTKRFDYNGGDDMPLDIRAYITGGGPAPPHTGVSHIWVTGAGTNGSVSDVATVKYTDDGVAVTEWSDGWAGSGYDFNYGKAIAVFGADPYIAGSLGTDNVDAMLALSYYEDSPGYSLSWYRTYKAGSFSPSVTPNHEGRGIVVLHLPGDSNRSIYITGTSREAGEGRQFATWRYKE